MELRHLSTLIAVPALFSLAACSSIIHGGHQDLFIQSTPPGASVAISNHAGANVFRSVTPCNAPLKRSAGFFKGARYHVHVSKDGYAPTDIDVNTHLSGWYWGNLGFGGIIGFLIIDPATGGMWSLDVETVSADLQKRHASFFKKTDGLQVVLRKELPSDLASYLKPLPRKS